MKPEEIEEIENYLADNLVAEKEVAKAMRPKEYFFIRVDLNAEESEISIGKSNNVQKRGLSIQTTGLQSSFMLREEGFKV